MNFCRANKQLLVSFLFKPLPALALASTATLKIFNWRSLVHKHHTCQGMMSSNDFALWLPSELTVWQSRWAGCPTLLCSPVNAAWFSVSALPQTTKSILNPAPETQTWHAISAEKHSADFAGAWDGHEGAQFLPLEVFLWPFLPCSNTVVEHCALVTSASPKSICHSLSLYASSQPRYLCSPSWATSSHGTFRSLRPDRATNWGDRQLNRDLDWVAETMADWKIWRGGGRELVEKNGYCVKHLRQRDEDRIRQTLRNFRMAGGGGTQTSLSCGRSADEKNRARELLVVSCSADGAFYSSFHSRDCCEAFTLFHRFSQMFTNYCGACIWGMIS